MASPTGSKVGENEVSVEPHHRRAVEVEEDPFLMRQSSIYSLTLDEIQNTVCEPGKSFGSMNMDEFLNNIWNVEEGISAVNNTNNHNGNMSTDSTAPVSAPPSGNGGPPLHRQGSLSIPSPLCGKTVDEVWTEIHEVVQEVEHLGCERVNDNGGNANAAQSQPTLGEMTLEDFLIKAGVVREGLGPASPQPPPPVTPVQQNYGLQTGGYPIGNVVGPAGYDYHMGIHHGHGHGHVQQVVSEGHVNRNRNGYGYAVPPVVRVGSPESPVSSDGVGMGPVEREGNGRKREADGVPVERRQRRMIKNRESAARSRARKQAYTVELEAELTALKEENARLKEEERRAQALRKQMIAECMAKHSRSNAQKVACSLRRHSSGPW